MYIYAHVHVHADVHGACRPHTRPAHDLPPSVLALTSVPAPVPAPPFLPGPPLPGLLPGLPPSRAQLDRLL